MTRTSRPAERVAVTDGRAALRVSEGNWSQAGQHGEAADRRHGTQNDRGHGGDPPSRCDALRAIVRDESSIYDEFAARLGAWLADVAMNG